MVDPLTDLLTRISNELTNEADGHSGSARRKLLDAGRILMLAKRQGWGNEAERDRAAGLAQWGIELAAEAMTMRYFRNEVTK